MLTANLTLRVLAIFADPAHRENTQRQVGLSLWKGRKAMSLCLCLIGKYFPIQGGVSKDNQWLAYALARAGFHLHIVTNAQEVELQYRCLPWSSFPALSDDCPGSITINTTSKEEQRHYIPYANPFVTKLAGLATKVIQTYQCNKRFFERGTNDVK